ncbi:MAG: DUF3023 domain-containing protein [Ehrlichia sp.]
MLKKIEVLYLQMYIFLVKRKKLVKFISEVINDDKPGATFQLSDYGNIVYTRLHRKSTTQKKL